MNMIGTPQIQKLCEIKRNIKKYTLNVGACVSGEKNMKKRTEDEVQDICLRKLNKVSKTPLKNRRRGDLNKSLSKTAKKTDSK